MNDMLDVFEVKLINPFGSEEVEIVEGKEALEDLKRRCESFGGNIIGIIPLKVLDFK